jgi:transposase
MADTAFRPKSRTEQIVEARLGRPVADALREMYHERGLSQQDIATELDVARSTVIDWMRRYGIESGYNRSGAAA